MIEDGGSSSSSSAGPEQADGSGTEAAPDAQDETVAGSESAADSAGEAIAAVLDAQTTGAVSDGASGSTGDDEAEGTTTAPAIDGDPPQAPPANATDANLLVALVGDMGTGANTKAVYQRVLDEGADFLIILGDFDYVDSPALWEKDLNSVLGPDFPVFGVIGNHDVAEWDGYQAKFKARLAKISGAQCTGEYGVDASCKYRGLHFVLSGIGTIGNKAAHEAYIADALAADDSLWSLCVWHKNQRDLQAGDKGDEVGWTAFQHCQNAGAPVIMGHEHSYARTRGLTNIGHKDQSHGATGLPELIELAPGSTFTAVSGLGGKAIRDYEPSLHKDEKWWATLYAADYFRQNGVEKQDFEADHGVLFMRFNVDGDPRAAHGYFKNIQGEMVDEFDVVQK